VIDTHCHLTFPEFRDRVGEVLDRASARDVSGCITISTTLPDAADALRIAKSHPRVWATAGVHPGYADQGPHDWAQLRVLAADPRCVAFGELGLDNHYPDPTAAVQRAVLDEQLAAIADAWQRGTRKPLVLHCREAFADLIPVLKASALDPARMVFHCFTGSPDDMRALLDFGAMVSFTGVVTYRNAEDVRTAARLAPLDRIMVETDAPFLPPEPHRRERPCEPWMSSVTARSLAELRGESWETFHTAINANTERFFGVS
jgi:TatD DNase family protein